MLKGFFNELDSTIRLRLSLVTTRSLKKPFSMRYENYYLTIDQFHPIQVKLKASESSLKLTKKRFSLFLRSKRMKCLEWTKKTDNVIQLFIINRTIISKLIINLSDTKTCIAFDSIDRSFECYNLALQYTNS